MDFYDYFLHFADEETALAIGAAFQQPGEMFDYIGQIPSAYDADGVPTAYQAGYFANLRLPRWLAPGELSEYTIEPPETPFRVFAGEVAA